MTVGHAWAEWGGSELVRRTMASVACVAAILVVVGLLGACGSTAGDNTAGTGKDATSDGYCAALRRMERTVGSLQTAQASLGDEAAAKRTIAALRDVHDHAPGTLPSVWKDVIKGYQAQAAIDRTDRTAAIKAAAAKAAAKVPKSATTAEKWQAIGKAAYKALRQDQTADAPYEKRAHGLLGTAVPEAIDSAKGVCGIDWGTS